MKVLEDIYCGKTGQIGAIRTDEYYGFTTSGGFKIGHVKYRYKRRYAFFTRQFQSLCKLKNGYKKVWHVVVSFHIMSALKRIGVRWAPQNVSRKIES